MAVIGNKEKITLKMELDAGVVDGKQKIKSKAFTNIKASASDENLHGTAELFAGLQNLPLLNIKKVEETVLISQ